MNDLIYPLFTKLNLVGVRLRDGLIVWSPLHGRYGKTHDISIARESGLFAKLGAGEKILADLAYIGVNAPTVTPYKKPRLGQLTVVQRDHNKWISKIRIVVERVFAVMKRFSVLSGTWRNSDARLAKCFNVIAILTNIRFKFHPIHAKECGNRFIDAYFLPDLISEYENYSEESENSEEN